MPISRNEFYGGIDEELMEIRIIAWLNARSDEAFTAEEIYQELLLNYADNEHFSIEAVQSVLYTMSVKTMIYRNQRYYASL